MRDKQIMHLVHIAHAHTFGFCIIPNTHCGQTFVLTHIVGETKFCRIQRKDLYQPFTGHLLLVNDEYKCPCHVLGMLVYPHHIVGKTFGQ